MGISVKSRSRKEGTEKTHMVLGPTEETKKKLKKACDAFDLVPYFAILIDDKNSTNIYILTLEKFMNLHKPKKMMIWYMGKKWTELYLKDSDIKIVEFKHEIKSWW